MKHVLCSIAAMCIASNATAIKETVLTDEYTAYAGVGVNLSTTKNYSLLVAEGDNVAALPIRANPIPTHTGKQFGGSICFGFGKIFTNNLYVSIGATIDMSKDKTAKSGSVMHKTNGIIPSIAAMFGGYLCAIDTLVYMRAGASYVQAKREDSTENAVNATISMNKFAPTLGIGISKKINNVSVMCEVDYLCSTKKCGDKSYIGLDHENFVQYTIKRKGITARLMAAYHF